MLSSRLLNLLPEKLRTSETEPVIAADLAADIAEAKQFPQGFHAWLRHWAFKNRESGDILTFRSMWPGQAEFADKMIEVARHAQEIREWLGIFALKAGKLGFTELECAWDGYVAWARRNARVHVFSKEGESAKAMLALVKFGLQRMEPAWGIRFVGSDNREIEPDRAGVSVLRFAVLLYGQRDLADTRSVWAYSTGTFPSIDQSAFHSHIDEWAHMQDPGMVWGAVATTIAPSGTCHIVTRGAGEFKDVEDVWKAAVAKSSKLEAYFAPYTARPGRDAAWLQAEAASHPTIAALAHYAAETPEDAFLGDEDNDFVPIELWDKCFDPTLAAFIEDPDGSQWEAYFRPEGRRGRFVGNLPPGDKRTIILSADAGVTHDTFGVLAAGRHPTRPDDPAIFLCRVWRPDDFVDGVIDFATVESWIRTVCEGGCVLGHPQYAPWKGGGQCRPLRSQQWEPGDCPACKRIDAADASARVAAYNVWELVYDPYQLAAMAQSLRRDGVVYCHEMIQAGPRLTADRKLFDMIAQARLAHMGDYRLREHISNAKAKTQRDEESKLRIVKKAPHRRIDLAVCASMAVSEVMRLNL